MNKQIKPIINDAPKKQYGCKIMLQFKWLLLRLMLLLVLTLSQNTLVALDGVNSNAYQEMVEDEIVTNEVSMNDVCIEEQGRCLDDPATKTRIVSSLAVARDCWKYEYIKNCNKVPSKNDCHTIPVDSFNLSKEECLTTTKMGERSFCLNMKKTFSHTYQVTESIDKSTIIMDPDNKQAVKELLCETFCLDGNCPSVFKATQGSNNELASSIAQLEMLSNINKGLIDANSLKFDIFSAAVKQCHNKKLHSNCCNQSGWVLGTGLAKCPSQAVELANEWRKGKCEYIDEYCSKKEKITNICLRKTKSYCCFPTVLAKVIHRGARNQLGKNLGSAEHPECGGLTLSEIESIDFGLIDFKEFFDSELQPMMKGYSSDDNEALMKRSFPSGTAEAGSKAFPSNSQDGLNKNLPKDLDGEGR